MKFRGPLGLPRIRSFGPIADKRPLFSQEISGSENFDEAVEEIMEENNITFDGDEDLSEDDIQTVAEQLAQRTFPDSERRQERFLNCLESSWANNWSRGFSSAGNMENLSNIERLSLEATGCAGMVEANTLGP